MYNEPTLKVEQHLEGAINRGLLTPVEAAEILSERPLLGQLYLDRNVASKCSDIRKASQHPAARHTLWVVKGECCQVCEKNGFCIEAGKKLIQNFRAKSALMDACRHLMECGRIFPGEKIENWNDLRQAMLPSKTEIKERIYPYSPPIVEVPPLKVDAVAQDEILKQAGARKEKGNATILDAINAREILPIAQFIGELLLKNGSGINIIKSEVEKRFPDRERVKAAVEFLKINVDPVLLMTRLAIYPLLFQDCQKTKDFLRTNSIKVANVFPVRACQDCRNKINGVCSLIGAKIVENGICDDEANQAIDELSTMGRLSSSQVRELKGIPDRMKRLVKAVGLAFSQGRKGINSKTTSTCGSPNGLIQSAGNFANRENSVLWAMDALAKTATVTQIRNKLNRDDADQIVCDALASTSRVHADSLDTCLHDKYVFASDARLVRADKCSACPHADQLQCRRHGLVFSLESVANETENVSPEAREVLSYFADSRMVADVDPDNTKKTIDIQFKNEGAEMTIDLGKQDTSGAITNYQQLYDFLGPNVEVGPKLGGVAPMEIQGLGTEMDISAVL
jgi:hypothetical protein